MERKLKTLQKTAVELADSTRNTKIKIHYNTTSILSGAIVGVLMKIF